MNGVLANPVFPVVTPVGAYNHNGNTGGAFVMTFTSGFTVNWATTVGNYGDVGYTQITDLRYEKSGRFLWFTGISSGPSLVVSAMNDRNTAVDVTLNVCAMGNGRYFGGGMKIAPHAELDDGLFDVVTLGDLTFAETLGLTTKIYAGTHLRHKKAASRRARVVDAQPVSPNQVLALDIDGEGIGQLPARFTVLPRALRVVIP